LAAGVIKAPTESREATKTRNLASIVATNVQVDFVDNMILHCYNSIIL
jgi:hypothetical protein